MFKQVTSQMKKVTLILFILFSFSHSFAQLARGDRTLSWQIDVAEDNDYDAAFTLSKTACMSTTHMAVRWSRLEPDTGQFDDAYIGSRLDAANIYFPAFNTKLELQISPIYSSLKQTPSELMGVDFYTPLMIRRFKVLLDTVFKHIPNIELEALTIGNEHDARFGTDPVQYNYYKTFLDAVVPYAKQLYFDMHGTDLKVETTFTYKGLTDNTTKPLCKYVNEGLDIVATTYYPLNNDFTMKSPTAPVSDFPALVAIYNDVSQPIYFVECGYSTSTHCNSNETKQMEFFQNVFTAWDTDYANVKYISLFKLTDWSQAKADELALEFNLTDLAFVEYLRTLGVRTWANSGTSKLAYDGILCELNARNWCAVDCLSTGMNEGIEAEFIVYPNPVNSTLNITPYEQISRVVIYNSLGIQLLESTVTQIDTSFLPKGIYFVNIYLFKGGYYTKKFIKE